MGVVRPVAMFARRLTLSEAKEGLIQQFVSIVHCVMQTV